MSTLETLDVGLANELKLAFRRHGYSSEEVKRLSEGDTLGQFRNVLLGHAEIKMLDCFRETGELTGTNAITIPVLPRPTPKALRSKYDWIREKDGIEADTSPTDAVTLALGVVLRPKESSINGQEYERRRLSLPGLLGYQQAAWLVENQDDPKLAAFKALCGKIYIDFPGLVVVDADGRRLFPDLDELGGRWDLCWSWTGHDLDQDGRLASSRK